MRMLGREPARSWIPPNAALAALESETGTSYDAGRLPLGSHLLDLVCHEVIAESEDRTGDADWAARRAATRALDALPLGPALFEPTQVVQGAHAGCVACLAMVCIPGKGAAVLSGGADGCLAATEVATGAVLASSSVAGSGVLSLAVLPDQEAGPLVAAGCMDGAVVLVRAELAASPPSLPILATCAGAHRKYVTALAWAPQPAGAAPLLLSGSWDESAALHATDPEAHTLSTLCRLPCDGHVEGLVFWPRISGGAAGRGAGVGTPGRGPGDGATVQGDVDDPPAPRFLAAVRGSTVLLELVVERSGPGADSMLRIANRHGLNEDPDDPHLSFSARGLAWSPCGGFLAVATDAGRVLLMGPGDAAGALRPLRRLFGLPLDRFQNWGVGWAGAGVVCAAGAGGAVHAFHAATGKCVGVLRAHTPAAVRALVGMEDGQLATSSFDGSIRLFA
uniref:Uncharacterized protein n=1 Tax=Auxenochlorella protothecoides TaxID=3075 RepID=A0A1D2A1A6_AUXPR